jgi:hypothetical protein
MSRSKKGLWHPSFCRSVGKWRTECGFMWLCNCTKAEGHDVAPDGMCRSPRIASFRIDAGSRNEPAKGFTVLVLWSDIRPTCSYDVIDNAIHIWILNYIPISVLIIPFGIVAELVQAHGNHPDCESDPGYRCHSLAANPARAFGPIWELLDAKTMSTYIIVRFPVGSNLVSCGADKVLDRVSIGSNSGHVDVQTYTLGYGNSIQATFSRSKVRHHLHYTPICGSCHSHE